MDEGPGLERWMEELKPKGSQPYIGTGRDADGGHMGFVPTVNMFMFLKKIIQV